jgi:tetratricopeptide (TPR) repeat protein
MSEMLHTEQPAVQAAFAGSIGERALAAGRTGDHILAFQLLHEALRMHPDSVDILFNLAVVLRQMGRVDEAKHAYEKVLALSPSDADAMYNLANLYYAAGEKSTASFWFRQTLRVRPSHVGACNNLGAMCESDGDFDAAARLYRQGVDADPGFAEGWANLGSALSRLGRGREAEEICRRALALNGTSAEAHNNLGGILRERGDLAGAQAEYRKAIALRPGFVEAMNNLALTLHADARIQEEIDILHLCLEARPDYADAHHNLAIAYLTGGRLEEGWTEYEWRFHTARQENPFRVFDTPCWDGTPLTGKRILLHAEQGLGDTIQFVRYASLLARDGATVIVESQRELVCLLSWVDGISAVVARGTDLPQFDVHCPLLSVPRRCKTTLESIPAAVPYIHPDPELVDRWRDRVVSSDGNLRVGLVWAGNPAHPNDRDRSLRSSLVNDLTVPGTRFYTLQRGEKAAARPGVNVADFGPELETLSDVAAFLEHLDLVITVDTALAHLAGAMGKPVWMLIPRIPDWRWMMERSDSPWYPTMRIFRQHAPGQWDDVLGDVRQALADLVGATLSGRQSTPLRAEVLPDRACDQIHELERKQHALISVQRGLELAGQARILDAEGAFREALTVDSACIEAHGYLGRILRDRGQLDQAEQHFREALALGPDAADPHLRLAEILTARHAYPAARQHLRMAATLQPNEARVLIGFGDLSGAQGRWEEARGFYERALAIEPSNARLCIRMGNLCRAQVLTVEAEFWYDQAITLNADDPEAHWNLAQLLLLIDRYEEGWKEYAWRWKHPRFATPARQFKAPQWRGEPLKNRRILLHAEQGFGDVIQFIRYASLLAATGAEVYAGIPSELDRLMRDVKGIKAVCLDPIAVPPIDFHCPLLDVPRLVGTTSETIPFEGSYIRADNKIIEVWKRRLGDSQGKMRVGITWAGSRHHENDRNRSFSPRDLAPLWTICGATFVSLQRDAATRTEDSLVDALPLQHFEDHLTDFAETAGLIACLDLVITADTAVAHLAGAMGKRVWTLLPFAPEWRWGLGRSTTSWYPTMTLYRQSVPSSWSEVTGRVSADLQSLIHAVAE